MTNIISYSIGRACTGKIMKNALEVLERGQNLLKNGIINFAFRLSQSSVIALQS